LIAAERARLGGAGGVDIFNLIAVQETNVNPPRANSKIAKNSTLINPSVPDYQQSGEERLSNIAEPAYYKAEARVFSLAIN
jgi:hypothetical protein